MKSTKLSGMPRYACRIMAGSVLFAVIECGYAQMHPSQTTLPSRSAASPQFDISVVRPSDPKGGIVGIIRYPGGKVQFSGLPVEKLIEEAYGVSKQQVEGGPDWIYKTPYDITAIPGDSSQSRSENDVTPKSPLTGEQRLMLQNLLRDRFGLVVHQSQRPMPVYVLTRNRKPLRLEDSKDKKEFPWVGGPEGGGLWTRTGVATGVAGKNIDMKTLAERLSMSLDRRVIDESALTGRYDFLYRLSIPSSEAKPDIVDVVKASLAQLGLALNDAKRPLDLIQVKSVQQPGPN